MEGCGHTSKYSQPDDQGHLVGLGRDKPMESLSRALQEVLTQSPDDTRSLEAVQQALRDKLGDLATREAESQVCYSDYKTKLPQLQDMVKDYITEKEDELIRAVKEWSRQQRQLLQQMSDEVEFLLFHIPLLFKVFHSSSCHLIFL